MRTSLLIGSALLTLAGCGGSSGSTDAGPGDDASRLADTGSVDAGTLDTGSTPDTGSSETTYMLPTGDCFTFATATHMDAMSMTCGDMQALSGANVDLDSPSGPDGMGAFCPLAGTFASLADIPTSTAGCAWTPYVEGLDPLDGHGYIVRDATQTHHYRMRIVSNAQPALIFSFDTID